MQVLGDLMEHVRRVSRMGRAVQVDLVAVSQSGALSQRDWAGMVQTCRNCDWAGPCDRWLETHACATRAPARCLNRHRFDRLGAGALREKDPV